MMSESGLKKEFKRAAGNFPYPYQLKAMLAILAGKSLVLRAPTGSGKTLAATIPMLAAKKRKLPFRKNAVYSIPLRALTHSLHQSSASHLRPLCVTVQTGEMKRDPHFEGDVVFATIDQSLSSFFQFPLSLSRRQANINTGAFLDSLLIFDECHLMAESFPTAVWMASMLKGASQFVFMTATLPSALCQWLADKIGGEFIDVAEADIAQMANHRERRVFARTDLEEMTADKIASRAGRKNLVICNTVAKAQEIYQGLRALFPEDEVDIVHSRFLPEDRAAKEERIKPLFEPGNPARIFLVATQVIEVGIDISADAMHTEISPADSFLQRIGRLARKKFEGARQEGTVWVYSRENPAPYNRALCLATFSAIARMNEISYADSLRLIEEVYGESYVRDKIGQLSRPDEQAIAEAFSRHDKASSQNLVRSMDSVFVTMQIPLPAPEDFYRCKGLSVNRNVVRGYLARCQKEGRMPGWALREAGDEAVFEEASANPNAFLHALAINPENASYTRKAGLSFFPGPSLSFGFEEKKWREPIDMRMDTYEEHLLACKRAFDALYAEKERAAFPFAAKAFGVSEADAKELFLLCLALHDAAKLSEAWQKKAREIQTASGKGLPEAFLAHMDRSEDGGRIKLPKHAPESAAITEPLTEAVLSRTLSGDGAWLKNAFVSRVVACHHSPDVSEISSFSLACGAKESLLRVIRAFGLEGIEESGILASQRASRKFHAVPFEPHELPSWLAYSWLVRILRLSDQKSFEFIEEARKTALASSAITQAKG